MNTFKARLTTHPLSTVVLTIAVIVIIRIGYTSLLDLTTPAGLTIRTIYGDIVGLGLAAIIISLGWGKMAGITTSPANWRRFWWLALIPWILIALLNLNSVEFDLLTFTPTLVAAWVVRNVGIGLFEEVVLRGFAFYVLYRAWGQTRRGVWMAGLGQALIFGLLHYLNLMLGRSFEAVTYQVVLATLLGIGFAGLAIYTRSIWPGVFAHAFIDALASVEKFFVPASLQLVDSTPMDSESFIVATVIIFVLTTLPALWFLSKANLHPTLA